MEKKRITPNLVAVVLFAAAIAAVPLFWLFAPVQTFSAAERRNLAEPPKLSLRAEEEWSFDDDTEAFLADRMPLREVLVGINAYEQLLTGRQAALEVYRDREGYLVEAPIVVERAEAERRLSRIARFSEAVGLPAHLLAVPSTGYLRRDALPKTLAALYHDDTLLQWIEAYPGLESVPLPAFFERGREWFYRTDHHWTADGAYAAYCAYMEATGREALPYDAFYAHRADGYVGSTRSRSALWLTPGEQLVFLEPTDRVRVTFSDREGVFGSLLFEEHLSEYDWYPIFVDGNHPVTVIENLDAAEEDVLLLLKDSFGNSLVPLLVPSYRKIVMVDPRYYRGSVSELAAEHGASELLLCYSLERIMTDTALLLLK